MPGASPRPPLLRGPLFAVFFASGLVALVYEVLWVRDLRVVFGSGAYAAATTLAVFFAGIAVGSEIFGARAARSRNPLRLYAGLELGVAVAALLSFCLPIAHTWVFRAVVLTLGGGEAAIVAARVLLAFVFLLPPAVFLGGTLPVIGEIFVRRPSELATETGRLYAVNTIGPAVGALLGGFALPVWFGFRGAYTLAITVNVRLAVVALVLSRSALERSVPATSTATPHAAVPRWLAAFAFASGLATIALEVLWTRMFALVLNSSLYAFSAILVVFLSALAIGAFASTRLVARLPPDLHLFALLLGAGLAVGASPFVLHWATGQLGSIPSAWGFGPYLALVFGTVGAVVLPPAALCGAVLPSLLRHVETPGLRPGAAIGRIVAINTVGGIVGSLLAGFVLLPWVGLWRSVSLAAFLYFVLAVFSVRSASPAARYLRPAALIAAVLFGTFLDPTRLVLIRAEPDEHIERIWETASGIVAVTRNDAGRRIRLDNTYILGGTEGREEEAWQADLPLALHGQARRVFFLGLGSGITAAAALRHPDEHVTATELVPEVIEASRTYFEDAAPLFTDERADVVAGDGRMILATSDQQWDVIISDLFIPWHEGTGSLYTRDHFEVARDRLADGGLFAQWLPLFQLTRTDFDTIVRTMLDVFPHVTLWHTDFRGGEPIAALVGSQQPLAAGDLSSTLRAHFVGDLARHRALFAGAELNTDDHPVLEHRAPFSQAAVRSGEDVWLVGDAFEHLRNTLSGPSD